MRHDGLLLAMIHHDQGDARRINHFLKVYAFAQTIALQEQVDETSLATIEATAICHDIGIRTSEQKYGTCTYAMQQSEGAIEARVLLPSLGYPEKMVRRICHIISLHHTFEAIDGIDFRILVEADLLVNLEEKNSDATAVETMRRQIFRTKAGLALLDAYLGKRHGDPG